MTAQAFPDVLSILCDSRYSSQLPRSLRSRWCTLRISALSFPVWAMMSRSPKEIRFKTQRWKVVLAIVLND
jgi:hypothetical protein